MSRFIARAAFPASLLVSALGLGACTSTPIAQPASPQVPAAYRHARPTAGPVAAPIPQDAWWQVFRDPTLDALEARASSANTTIQAAAARLAKARALVRRTDAARSPQVALRAGAGRQGGPVLNAAGGDGTLVVGAADLSYEADLFGRLQLATDAADLDAQSQEALLRGARLLVQADVAQTYLALRAVDAERALVRTTAAAYRDTVNITERRYRAGSVAELDWVRARTELASIESEALALERRRTELEHALALLAGEAASGFELPQGEWTTILPDIPAGVPGAVLTRRPDISAAQRSMLAAQSRLGLARTAWFPSLTLTASGGYASASLGDLLQASMRTWGVGALLGLTLLDGGRREAEVQGANADLEGALASYREQILVAFRDVEDQLSSLQLLADQAQVQSAAVDLGSRASLLADSRYRSGLASQLDVLDARRVELRE
ncbi:MAG TPA: efflux transporter outer membrane subunit, partial [Ramlibacter sp.]|nr:efflux transporter outer membrane subunit [Ramlibacter sp.]